MKAEGMKEKVVSSHQIEEMKKSEAQMCTSSCIVASKICLKFDCFVHLREIALVILGGGYVNLAHWR